ncbi:hypothetical protein [Actinomadura alba]|uniref:hypothetical protein n=1 Tax=Actinomadura alba TaxID=406431 RepID=UPI001C9C5F41|nr:hypothetical protein [Actinomadura alba]
MGPDLLEQAVARWRRGHAPKRRPRAFLLPAAQPPFVHEIDMYEHDGFRPRFSVRDGLPDPHSDVLLREVDGLLRVHPVPAADGNPSRWRRPPAVRLAHGQWLRWRINYRFTDSCDGDWTYRQDTLNIVHGRPRPDLFLGTPAHEVDELARLR